MWLPGMFMIGLLLAVSTPNINTDNVYSKTEQLNITTTLNRLRLKHQAPPVQWDNGIANAAQNWAEYLASTKQFKHSQGPYGENLYYMMSTAPRDNLSKTNSAINSWYGEIKYYNWSKPGFSMNTGHFTCLVWKGTTKYGMGIASVGTETWIVYNSNICNVITKFASNVLPPVDSSSPPPKQNSRSPPRSPPPSLSPPAPNPNPPPPSPEPLTPTSSPPNTEPPNPPTPKSPHPPANPPPDTCDSSCNYYPPPGSSLPPPPVASDANSLLASIHLLLFGIAVLVVILDLIKI